MPRPTFPAALGLLVLFVASAPASAADIFVRFKVTEPAGEKFRVVVGGFPHQDPWSFPERTVQVAGGAWSEWVDLRDWKWAGKFNRQGGVAEWPAMRLSVLRAGGDGGGVKQCSLDVQLADRADEAAVVHSFTERGTAGAIGFLVPHPLREHKTEFETGSQMTARHLAWAKEATGGRPVRLKQFQFITSLWGPYDPALARQSLQTLKLLGFNVVGGADPAILRAEGLRTYTASWLYVADPEQQDKEWKGYAEGALKRALASEDGRWSTADAAHWVISDEISALDLHGVKPERRDAWFREYLKAKGVTDERLGQPVNEVTFPADALHEKTLPKGADLKSRKRLYYAAKFGQWWSARQVRRASDLIRASVPGAKTETLPGDHGFFGAWGPPALGMGYRMCDLFELGEGQETVDQLSSEDWLGLNHMYGPGATWTGAQSFEYFNALCRSAIGEKDIHLRALVTPSDDKYLRLKTYSALGQGTKSFFFWTFGPTYISTENYWSDLRSQYDGLVKLGRAIERSEEVLCAAKPVRDPVAILYSVSQDYWNNDDPAAFVEKRLLWHALRHLGVQPDFIREEDVEIGKLKNYKVLYVTDWCVTRKASAAIDAWVKDGGVVSLSAGACTRDEYFEPYVAPFAKTVWPDDAAATLKSEGGHAYNERVDLPTVRPMTAVNVELSDTKGTLPVLGCRLPVRESGVTVTGRFDDDHEAACGVAARGNGKVYAWGFMPMLAYGQLAGFKPTTLEEKWPAEPRALVKGPLDAASIGLAARPDVPVVEASLLSGEKGAALVLVNYTYQPIDSLSVELRLPPEAVGKVVSTDGKPVAVEKTAAGVRMRLPLEWTDVVLLPKP
jgi:hypothetical protein